MRCGPVTSIEISSSRSTPRERGLQPRGIGEVAAAHLGAARGERLERGRIAGQQDRLVPLVEQELGDAAAEVAGGSGDGDGGHA